MGTPAQEPPPDVHSAVPEPNNLPENFFGFSVSLERWFGFGLAVTFPRPLFSSRHFSRIFSSYTGMNLPSREVSRASEVDMRRRTRKMFAYFQGTVLT